MSKIRFWGDLWPKWLWLEWGLRGVCSFLAFTVSCNVKALGWEARDFLKAGGDPGSWGGSWGQSWEGREGVGGWPRSLHSPGSDSFAKTSSSWKQLGWGCHHLSKGLPLSDLVNLYLLSRGSMLSL